MIRAAPLLLALVLALAAPAYAQTQAPAAGNCSIALPYNPDEIKDCSPAAAAAYDFAFCGVTLTMTAAAAPQPGAGQAEALKKMGAEYVQLSQILSNSETFMRNAAMAQTFFDSLVRQPAAQTQTAMEYVTVKCGNIEAHHGPVLRELMQKMQDAAGRK